MKADYAREVRNLLLPDKVCAGLGLLEKARRQSGGGFLVLCPAHGEKHPSCSVSIGRDGTTRVRCFGCGMTGDALTLIAICRGLDLHRDFGEVLAQGAELADAHALAQEIRGEREPQPRVNAPPPAPAPPPEYPPVAEVQALWEASAPVSEDTDASAVLVARRIDPLLVDERKLARAIPKDASLPFWARYQGRSWCETGHRMLLRVFDARGALRSVRAWRVIEYGGLPKRLPPAGHRASDLVLGNRTAIGMLMGRVRATRVLIVEGEPDFVVWATRTDIPVLGIGSGSWGFDFARHLTPGAEVIIRTHADEAGERYAALVASTLGEACAIWRSAS